MKTDVTTYGSLLQSQNRAANGAKAAPAAKTDAKIVDPKLLTKNSAATPDYKVELSKAESSLPSVPSMPSAPSVSTPDLPKPEAKMEKPKLEDVAKEVDSKEIPKVEEKVRPGTLKKPAIIFIKGLDVFSSPSDSERGYAGVGKMAEAIEGSRIYGWDQHDEIIKEIEKREATQPIILVGHSFGGDTALEVADTLDSLDHKFRKVDLLITIDSVGFDNDIIPQNVKNHLNVFGENNLLLNDGPHVARRNEMTKVKNILSPLDHTELDDDREIQFEVVQLIQDTVSKRA